MSSVKSPHSPQGSGGGIFIFLIALGIIQMDIGGCADCRCRLDDKFSFRSTPGAMFCFVPSVMSPLLVSEWKKSTLIVINYRRFVCWWLASSWRLLKKHCAICGFSLADFFGVSANEDWLWQSFDADSYWIRWRLAPWSMVCLCGHN